MKKDIVEILGHVALVKKGKHTFWIESGKYVLEVEPFPFGIGYYDATCCPNWMYILAERIAKEYK